MSWVDITTAVGTAGAAVVALGLGLRAEWRAIRTERRARDEDERRQAIHIAAWLLIEQDDGDGPRELDTYNSSFDWKKAHFFTVIQNASEEPIWDVVVFTPIFGKPDFKLVEVEHQIMSIGPKTTRKIDIAAMSMPTPRIPAMPLPSNRFPLKVEFQDNAGRQWTKDWMGWLDHGRTTKPWLETATPWLGTIEEAERKSPSPWRRLGLIGSGLLAAVHRAVKR